MAIDLVARLSLDDQLSGPLASLNNKMMGMVGFAAITAGVGSVVKSYADFDTAVRKAATIAGATDKEFNAMSESAKELGATTSLSASEVANAMGEMAAKGYSATEVIDSMPGVIAAAEASGENLALTADTVSAALNIWSMKASEASDVADVLAMTANVTSAGITDMQYALKYAGAPAKALGMSLEEVSAAAGILADNSIEGSQAGTSLRQGLSSLAAPTKGAAKLMDQYGFSAENSNGKIKSMTDIIGGLKSSMEGMSQAQKVNYLKTLVGTEAMTSFLILTEAGPEKLAKLQKKLEDSGGAAAEAAEKMKAGIGGALQELSGKYDSFKIDLGKGLEPAVRTVVDAMSGANLQPMVDSMASFGQTAANVARTVIDNWNTIQNTVVLAAYAMGVYKTYTLAVAAAQLTLSAGIAIFNGLKAVINAVKLAQIALNLAMLANPVGVVIAAVTALIGVGVLLYQNWDKVTATMKSVWENFKNGKGVIFLLLGPIGLLIKTAITIAKNWKSTESVWSNVWNGMKASAEDTVNTVIAGINKMIDVINKLPGVNIPIVASVNWTNDVPPEVSKANASATVSNAVAGPHAIGNHGGWNEIRTDGTLRNLHAGERVLTAVENDSYKQMMNSGLPKAIARMASLKPAPIGNATTHNTNNVSNTQNYTTSAFELPAFNEVPILNAIRNLTNANGTAPVQESFKLDVTDIVTAIERMAKRAINVVVPQDGSANAVAQLRDIITGNQPTLTATETQAVSNSVSNSSFSESVSNVTTTDNSKKTTTQTIQPVVNLGGVHIDSKWDLDTRSGREQVAKKIAEPIAAEITAMISQYV